MTFYPSSMKSRQKKKNFISYRPYLGLGVTSTGETGAVESLNAPSCPVIVSRLKPVPGIDFHDGVLVVHDVRVGGALGDQGGFLDGLQVLQETFIFFFKLIHHTCILSRNNV